MRSPSGEEFPKAMRVRRRREYLASSRVGQRRHAPHFTVVCVPGRGGSRLGITVTRKIGGAVVRNLIKRRVREAFRRDPQHLVADHDLIVIAKQGAAEIPFDAVAHELAEAVAPLARSRRRA
jgi:ribonuclease P protein component